MAKISTYPADSTPNLNDYLIGTDVDDANNTKTYTIGSIIGLANLPNTYVPYTGAVGSVFLGSNSLFLTSGNISTSSGNITGGTITASFAMYSYGPISLPLTGSGSAGDLMVSSGPGVAPEWSSISSITNYGQFFSTLNPTFVANTPTAIQLNNTDASTTNGISIVLSTRITFSKTGKYKISYSCNLNVGASGNNHYMVLFLKKNGTTDVSNSTHRYLTTSNSYTIRQGGESLVDVTAGDYFELMCAMTSTNLSLVYVPATLVAPIAPLEPSTLVTVIQA